MNTLKNEFQYTPERFSTPLTHPRSGKTIIGKDGQPLFGVRIKQSKASKRRMIDRMERLHAAWVAMPEYFPTCNVRIGNDPRPYSVKQIFADLEAQIPKWESGTSVDILESFVIRHNFLVEHVKKHFAIDDLDFANELEREIAIRSTNDRIDSARKVFEDLFITTPDEDVVYLDEYVGPVIAMGNRPQ